jgi:hypothetical protein
MIDGARYPFVDANPAQPGTSLLPMLPLVLSQGGQQIEAIGLADTGSAVNVLPYSLGEQLGFVWQEQTTPLVLSGNLARLSARGVLVSATVAQFTPVRLVFFAWTQADASSGHAWSSRSGPNRRRSESLLFFKSLSLEAEAGLFGSGLPAVPSLAGASAATVGRQLTKRSSGHFPTCFRLSHFGIWPIMGMPFPGNGSFPFWRVPRHGAPPCC